jgi:Na+/proline symporter
VIALALAWALLISPSQTLASIGLVAFAAMAQFTPHLVLATTGRQRDSQAARASLLAGFLLWLYTLALPPILPEGWRTWLAAGRSIRCGCSASPCPAGAWRVWSLGVNVCLSGGGGAAGQGNPLPSLLGWQRQVSDLSELKDLTASFIGRERADIEFPAAQPVWGLIAARPSARAS